VPDSEENHATYIRITVLEHRAIKEVIEENMSFAAIGTLLECSASSKTAEVKKNRSLVAPGKVKAYRCEQNRLPAKKVLQGLPNACACLVPK
jgi:hypothetical protein